MLDRHVRRRDEHRLRMGQHVKAILHVRLAPRAGEIARVTGKGRHGQHDQRNDPDHNGGRDTVERKEETRHARRRRRRQKERRPTVESFRGEQPEQNDEAAEYPRQADGNMNQSERCHTNQR